MQKYVIVLHRTRTSFLVTRTPPFVNHCMRGLLHAIWRHPLPSVDTLRPLLRRRSQFGRLLVPECMSLFLVNAARTTHNYITGHTHLSIQIAKACAACIAPSACMASIYRGGTCSHSMIRMMRQACACLHVRRMTKRKHSPFGTSPRAVCIRPCPADASRSARSSLDGQVCAFVPSVTCVNNKRDDDSRRLTVNVGSLT